MVRGLAHPALFSTTRSKTRSSSSSSSASPVGTSTSKTVLGSKASSEDELILDTNTDLTRNVIKKRIQVSQSQRQQSSSSLIKNKKKKKEDNNNAEKDNENEKKSDDNNIGDIFSKFGAVPVSGRNFFKLLKNNETVI